MKRFAPVSFLPKLGGRRASFKIGVVATLAIAVAANIAVLGNLGVLFGQVVPGAVHQNLYEPYFQALDYKAMPASQMGIFRPAYDRLAVSLKGRGETALYQERGAMLSGSASGAPIRFVYLGVTPSLAQVLGVQAVAGRMLDAADSKQGAEPVVVVSARFARARFGDAKSALNRILKFRGKNRRIVGVLPAALDFPPGQDTAAWVPFPPEAPGKSGDIEFGMHALVRPAPGLSTRAIRAALDRAYRQSLSDYNPGMLNFIEPMHLVPRVATLAQREYGSVLTQLQLLELAALLLLVLVLANLTGLATADALARRHELATRAALGAGAFRLFSERARELGLLGLLGWGAGVGLGWLAGRGLAATVGQAGESVALSVPVLLLTLCAVLVVTTLLAAAGVRRLRTPRALTNDLMAGGHATAGRGLVRTLRALIVLQLAASAILLVTAGHLRANVFSLTHGDLGFASAQRVFFRVSLPGSEGNQTEAQYQAYVKQAQAFDNRFLERLNKSTGIRSASLITVVPFSGGSATTTAGLTPSSKESQQIINEQIVSKHAVRALGLHVLAGNPDAIFVNSSRAILLDATAAKRVWPDAPVAAVVGRQIYIGSNALHVAAVVAPLRMKPYGSIGGTVFRSFEPSSGLSGGPQGFVVHGALPSQALRKELADLVTQTNPQAKLRDFHSADELIAQAYTARSQLGRVFGALAVIAMLIAAVGLFALLAYRSLVRRPEFAIRGALGATPGRLFGSVFMEAIVLWGIGCVIGVPAAYGLSVFLASNLPELGLPTAWVAAAVAVGLGLIALAAAFVPARRAADIDLAGNLTN